MREQELALLEKLARVAGKKGRLVSLSPKAILELVEAARFANSLGHYAP